MTETTTSPVGTDLEIADVAAGSNSALLATLDAMRNGGSLVVSTIEDSSWDGRTAVFDAMTNALPVADNLGTVIQLRNWVIQPVEMPVDEKDASKGTQLAPRIILIDEDGSAYAAISSGILKSLENLVGVFGKPSGWPVAIPVVVSEERSRNGFRFMTVKIFRETETKAPKK